MFLTHHDVRYNRLIKDNYLFNLKIIDDPKYYICDKEVLAKIINFDLSKSCILNFKKILLTNIDLKTDLQALYKIYGEDLVLASKAYFNDETLDKLYKG